LSGHFFGTSVLVCSAAQYASWPRALQEAVEIAGREATAYQHALAAAEDDEILGKLDPHENDIVRLTAEEHRKFVAAVEPVLAKHRGSLDPKLFDYFL